MLIGKELGAAIASAFKKKLAIGAVKTKDEMASHFGIKPPSLQDWIKRGTIAKDKLPKLWCYFSDVADYRHWGMSEEEWPKGLSLSSNFQSGEDQGQSPDENKGLQMRNVVSLKIKPQDTITIRQYDTGGAMGHGLVLHEQPGVIQSWDVNREWLDKNTRTISSAANLCIVTGFGDSMRPMFNPGDPLLVDLGMKTMESDGIYFFRLNGEGFIKRLQRIPTRDGILILALSENKQYREFEITSDMDFEVIGKVLRVWCGTDF